MGGAKYPALDSRRLDRRLRKDILAYGRRKASGTGIRTEEDIERLIDESRA